MNLGRAPKRMVALGTAAATLLAPAAAKAQGCAMCYTAAAAQSQQGIRALDLGILMLLLPAVAIFAGIFWMAYRRRESWSRETPAPERPRPGSGLLPLDFPARQEGSW